MELFAAMTLTTSLSINVNVKRGSQAKTVKVKCNKTHFCHSLLLDFYTHHYHTYKNCCFHVTVSL